MIVARKNVRLNSKVNVWVNDKRTFRSVQQLDEVLHAEEEQR